MIRLFPLLALLSACGDEPRWEGTFDVPSAAAVLQPETGGPFNEPVGYGAGTTGGQVAMMALKSGRYVADNDDASFVRAAFLPTGRRRVVSGLAVYAPDQATVTAFVADRAYAQLLRVPHVVGVDSDGVPMRIEPTATGAEFDDADDSGDNASLDAVTVRLGYTSTEEWVVEHDGAQWWVTGSRSGLQPDPVVPGELWSADKRAVEFTLAGTGTRGDTLTFETDSGLEEIDLGGVPLHLAMAPDQSVLAIAVQADDEAFVALMDPATDEVKDTLALAADAAPGRMSWSPDGRLFVSDTRRPAAWEIVPDDGGAVVTEHPLPWPVFDVAPLIGAADLLYLAPVGGRSVWVLDLDEGLIDINPQSPGTDGMDFDTVVHGISAIPQAYEWLQRDDDGVPMRGRTVAVSLYTGRLVFMAEGTGCLVHDLLGPRTDLTGGALIDYTVNFGSASGVPYLEGNLTNNRHAVVSECGGVALRESWELTYRRDLQGWVVEGSRSGTQDAIAYEDQRYVSDSGAISFIVRSGASTSEDGWRISFTVASGVTEANGNNDEDIAREVDFDLPGDGVFLHYVDELVTEDGWIQVEDRPFLLVPAAGSDLFARVDPSTGHVEAPFW